MGRRRRASFFYLVWAFIFLLAWGTEIRQMIRGAGYKSFDEFCAAVLPYASWSAIVVVPLCAFYAFRKRRKPVGGSAPAVLTSPDSNVKSRLALQVPEDKRSTANAKLRLE